MDSLEVLVDRLDRIETSEEWCDELSLTRAAVRERIGELKGERKVIIEPKLGHR